MNQAKELKKIADDLNKQSQEPSEIVREVSRLIEGIGNLEEIRGNIEQAIHQTHGAESNIAKDYYDADAHLDEANRAFKMLRNDLLGI